MTRRQACYSTLGVGFPPVPDRPTHGKAAAALALLRDLVDSFLFVGELTERSLSRRS
jgi:hypothetical protein